MAQEQRGSLRALQAQIIQGSPREHGEKQEQRPSEPRTEAQQRKANDHDASDKR